VSGSTAEAAFEELARGGLGGAQDRAWDLVQRAWPEIVGRLEVFLRARRVPADLAEDCGQAVLVRVWRFRSSYRGASPPELAAWMYRITENETARALRAAAPAAEDESALDVQPDARPDPVELSEGRDDLRALAECLAGLDARQREVIELLYADDPRSEREAVDVLGLSKSYVHVLRRKALDHLARCLEGKGVE
jgi:RNA polymerase sigma factor (sigma-70 family)